MDLSVYSCNDLASVPIVDLCAYAIGYRIS